MTNRAGSGVGVGVGDGVLVGVEVMVGVGVGVAVEVAVDVAVGVGVPVAVDDGVGVAIDSVVDSSNMDDGAAEPICPQPTRVATSKATIMYPDAVVQLSERLKKRDFVWLRKDLRAVIIMSTGRW